MSQIEKYTTAILCFQKTTMFLDSNVIRMLITRYLSCFRRTKPGSDMWYCDICENNCLKESQVTKDMDHKIMLWVRRHVTWSCCDKEDIAYSFIERQYVCKNCVGNYILPIPKSEFSRHFDFHPAKVCSNLQTHNYIASGECKKRFDKVGHREYQCKLCKLNFGFDSLLHHRYNCIAKWMDDPRKNYGYYMSYDKETHLIDCRACNIQFKGGMYELNCHLVHTHNRNVIQTAMKKRKIERREKRRALKN